ncbi:unnamed protein product [Brassicogethes aeneus]|uniref:Uncharacterized protein n=1 Tax=Brassicogethes aeneus TaxID=1431903 RepID=A0A9P0BEE2_BRAAE|nr:unnamed protein product [Brassicogethes aeneus]
MNGFYVTVSIPLLLVLAGFNNAHGLTTFGKTNNQGNQAPTAQGRTCTSQNQCTTIKGTTCLRGFCLCGDNSNPINGKCNVQYKGPRHVCEKHEDCIDGADCLPKEKNKPLSSTTTSPADMICQCQEGLIENGHECAGGGKFSILPALVLIIIASISRIMN